MKQPDKILFTIPNFITAGSGRAMLNIIERLDKTRFAPAVCVSKLGGKLDNVVREMGIPLIEADFTVPAKPYLNLFSRARKAAQLFKPYGFDLWHSFHYAGEYTEPLIARFSGVKAWVYTKKNMSWGDRSWYLRSFLAKRIAVQNTDMLRDFFDNPHFRDKVRLIPRGVDDEKFNLQVKPSSHFRESLGIPRDSPLVGCVAHLVPVKGHPTLIEAAAKLPTVLLLLAGKPLEADFKKRLDQQIESLEMKDRVHFLGNVEDIAGLLSELDIFVLPTWDKWRREGCPVALLEAMACAKACIATDVPGSRDIIKDGISGLLVPSEDPDALADAIQRLIDHPDLREKLGAAARERVLAHYTIEQEVAAHEKLYEEILTTKTRRSQRKL
jgi:glycosyltransferase involved in cell wall biosynthesis